MPGRYERSKRRRRDVKPDSTLKTVARPLVDIDDPSNWPPAVREWSERYAADLRGTTAYTSDLAVPLEREDELRGLLAGHKLRAFHCTRLPDHEVTAIKTEGLVPLTEELVHRRIDRAHELGLLTDEAGEHLRAMNVFALGAEQNREDQVCLILGRDGLNDNGCTPLLSRWGGEGIYMADPDSEAPSAFIGRPAVVVAAIDLSVSHTISPTFPSLGKLLVGTLLGTEQRYADVCLRAPVPPKDVLAIWQPGDRDYDRHQHLPAA
jgi:hypothetical protein